MAKIVEKTSIDIVETAKTFEKYESLAIPLAILKPNSIRTYLCNARKEGILNGDFTVALNKIDKVSVVTRIG